MAGFLSCTTVLHVTPGEDEIYVMMEIARTRALFDDTLMSHRGLRWLKGVRIALRLSTSTLVK